MSPRPRTARELVVAAATHVENFFLEPARPTAETRVSEPPAGSIGRAAPAPAAAYAAPAASQPGATAPRQVIAVFGLARRCGATVVARALAAELAARDAAGAAAVASQARAAGLPLATPAAGRLAGALADVPGARPQAVGRLCLVEGADELALADTARHFAPLLIDAGEAEVGGTLASLADRVLLVARPGVEPALAELAVECVRREGVEPLVVWNRCRGVARQAPPDARQASAAEERLHLPDSRMGAQLALGGRQSRGELGRAVALLADRFEVAA